MKQKSAIEADARIRAALEELRALIAARFPAAKFSVVRGDDPEGFYLRAVVDAAEPDDVMDVVVDRLFELEVEEGLPIYVLPVESFPDARRQGTPPAAKTSVSA